MGSWRGRSEAARDPVSATDALDVEAKANAEVKELISAALVFFCPGLSAKLQKKKQYSNAEG